MGTRPGPEMSEPHHEDVLQFVSENSKPWVSTLDVAEEFDSVQRRTVFNRLQDLADRGGLRKDSLGGNCSVWYVPGAYETSLTETSLASLSAPSSDSQ
jgi:hypothetical protein